MRVLVYGAGGREHALAFKLSRSDHVSELFVWPGNAVTRQLYKTLDCPRESEAAQFVQSCHTGKIELVVVGTEAPLAHGLADLLEKSGIPCFGPNAETAKLESSKAFAKEILFKAKIHTAAYSEANEERTLRTKTEQMLAETGCAVVKASGLAAGKGVFICKNLDDVDVAMHHLYHTDMKSAAGTVIVEEFLTGRECSHFTMIYKNKPVSLGFAVDFKRLNDDDEGPNTGGMGSYSPVPWLPQNADQLVLNSVVRPLMEYLEKNKMTYTGFLYSGLMWGEDGPKVVEFNVRLGDPEAQILCTLDERDWIPVMTGASSTLPSPSSLQSGVGVVLASDGYPFQAPKEDSGVFDIEELNLQETNIFSYPVEDLTVPYSLVCFV